MTIHTWVTYTIAFIILLNIEVVVAVLTLKDAEVLRRNSTARFSTPSRCNKSSYLRLRQSWYIIPTIRVIGILFTALFFALDLFLVGLIFLKLISVRLVWKLCLALDDLLGCPLAFSS